LGVERDVVEVVSDSGDTMVDITGSPDEAANPGPQGNEEELGGAGSASDLAVEVEDTGESQEVAEPQPSYRLGHSWVTEDLLDSFEAEGLMDSESRSGAAPLGMRKFLARNQLYFAIFSGLAFGFRHIPFLGNCLNVTTCRFTI